MRLRDTRRRFLLASVGLLVAWLPIPVPIYVVNASGSALQLRAARDRPWLEAEVGATVMAVEYAYDGLCSPPDRWLPESFTGLEFKLADGSVVQVSREVFEAEAEYEHRWTYRFRG